MVFNGEKIKLDIFGASHSSEIGVNIKGIPSGIAVDTDGINKIMSRRAPGKNEYSTARKESDIPLFTCGVKGGVTTGDTITAVIKNTDTKSKDYEQIRYIPRPGHADYTAYVKYGKDRDFAGGGSFSGRMTAPLCVAGALCGEILKKNGIKILSRVYSVGNVTDEGELTAATDEKEFPTVSDIAGEKMRLAIKKAKEEGNSIGGVIEICVTGLPAGLGGPMFYGMESRISAAVFGIPAVKGIEFGRGFESARITGKENNDEFYVENKKVKTYTNNCGGILGGISNGMPLSFKAALKPTPSIAMPQKSVDLEKMENTTITVGGRHDPCVVIRALPAVEAATAVVLADMILENNGEV